MGDNNAVGGFSDSEMAEIRKLKGVLQQEMPENKFSNKGAVLWAVRNELDRKEQ